MWDDRCKVLHGRTLEEKKKIKRDKILKRARSCFQQQDRVLVQDGHIFNGGWERLEARGTLYLEKWVESYVVAASQKVQLEIQREKRGGIGVGINLLDHPVSHTAHTIRQSLANHNQATYGPDG